MDLPDLHAVIISWVGMGDGARRIAAAIEGHVAALTVIYSNPEEAAKSGPGDWLQVPNDHFFGAKFETALRNQRAGILLLLHADTHHDDWPSVVRACASAFRSRPDLGIWAPDFTHTQWTTPDVALGAVPGTPMVSVLQTDAIVAAFAPPICDRLRKLDYTGNNLGWGIDWAAIGCAYSSGMLVCRDTGLIVQHATSRGYGGEQAFTQMVAFFRQLTPAERLQIILLRTRFRQVRHERLMGILPRLYRRIRRIRPERSWQLD